jgi:glycine C-acetyltransferase/8-amino-7-oxononanoate synthase
VTPLDEHHAALAEALAARERAGLLRHMHPPRGLVDLASNDYLGLATHPHLVERTREAVERLGVGSGGSRLLTGQRAAFTELEERLAVFTGVEATLLFGSGYAANLGLLTAIVGWDDVVLSDHRNHASLIDGIRLTGARKVVYPHGDLRAVESALREPRAGRAFIVTESVFSMDGDLAALVELVDVAERQGALVIVDEAHATGLFGARGAGRVEELGLSQRVLATVHTGGKALGSAGAWVAGSRLLVDTLAQIARSFVFTTAPMPALTGALHAALDIVASEPQRRAEVHRKARLLRGALTSAVAGPAHSSPIVPLHVGDNDAAVSLQDALLAEGFDCRAVRPPTVPAGTARLRVTVRSPVPDEELLRFASVAGRLLPSAAAVPAR